MGKMTGRLYTADEVFKAIREASVNNAEDYREYYGDDMAKIVATIGGGIAYGVADRLGYDMKQLMKFCEEELND